jgi:hypothetical protein
VNCARKTPLGDRSQWLVRESASVCDPYASGFAIDHILLQLLWPQLIKRVARALSKGKERDKQTINATADRVLTDGRNLYKLWSKVEEIKRDLSLLDEVRPLSFFLSSLALSHLCPSLLWFHEFTFPNMFRFSLSHPRLR